MMKTKTILFVVIILISSFVFAEESFTLRLDKDETLNSMINAAIQSGGMDVFHWPNANPDLENDSPDWVIRPTSCTIELNSSTGEMAITIATTVYQGGFVGILLGPDRTANVHFLLEGIPQIDYDAQTQTSNIVFNNIDVSHLDVEDWPPWMDALANVIVDLELYWRDIQDINIYKFYPFLDPHYFRDGYPTLEVTDNAILLKAFINQPLMVANRSVTNPTGFLTGSLSVNDITTPALTQENFPSPSNVLARENDTYTATTHNPQIGDESHWNWTNDVDYKRTTDPFELRQLYFDDGLTAWFKAKNTASVTSNIPNSQVSLQIQDPWLSQNTTDYTTIQNGTHQVFLNQGDLGNPNSNKPIYHLRAPGGIAQITLTGIYTFDHWEGTNIDFGNGATRSDQRETKVVFLDENATVLAVYSPVNERENYTLTIPANQTLTIPAGGNYQFADHFRIRAKGPVSINGTEENPVSITSSGKESQFEGMGYEPTPTTLDTLLVIENDGTNVQIDNLHIDNAYGGIAIRNTNGVVELNHVEISNTNIGLLIDHPQNTDIALNYLNLHDNDLGISFGAGFSNTTQESSIGLYRSVIWNNRVFGIYMWPDEPLDAGVQSEHYFGIINCTFWEPANSTNYNAISSKDPPGGSNVNYGQFFISLYNTIFVNSGPNMSGNFGIYAQGGNLAYNLSAGELFYLQHDPEPFPTLQIAQPWLYNPAYGNFHLLSYSPAINAGVTLAACEWTTEQSCINEPSFSVMGLEDPDGTTPDIGAYYFHSWKGYMEPVPTTWDEPPVYVGGDLILPEGGTLTIKPGVTVFVKPGATIKIAGGTLKSEGTAADSIKFTSLEQNQWGGIEITKGVGELKYTTIQQAEKGLVVDQGQGHLSRSTIQQNTSGVILTHTATFDISDNTIRDNTTGLQLLYSPVTVKANSIQTNEGTGLYLYRSDADVLQNQVQYNRTGVAIENLSNASFVTTEDPNNLSLNNTMTDNSEYGLTIDAGSNPLLGTAQKDAKGFWAGGFNVIHSNQTGDIEAGNKDKVDARLNWWDGKPVIHGSGSLILDPTADDKFGPPKGLSKSVTEGETSSDTLDPRLAAAVALELDSAYTEAVQAYQAIIATAPDSAIAQTALGGIVRCYYRQDNLEELVSVLTTVTTTYSERPLSTLAADYAVTAQTMLAQYQTALQTGDAVYADYTGAEPNPEAAAAVLFEQVLIAFAQDSSTGLGKWTTATSSQRTQQKLDTILDRYRETQAAQLVRRLFNRSSNEPVAPPLPTTVTLEHAYPNPFNPTTTISYGLPNDQPVTLVVYDLTGRKVKRLVSARQSAGWHQVQWDGTNGSGRQVSSGVYFYRLRTSKHVKVHKMMLIR